MTTARDLHHHGGTLVMTLLVLAMLAFAGAQVLRRVEPKFRSAHQTVGWQEARLAAESGIDVAMAELAKNATGPSDGPWTGWKQQHPDGTIGPVLADTLSLVNSVLSTLGNLLFGPSNATRVSKPIFLDNLAVSAAAGPATEVDVQLWAVYPNGSPDYRWFRLRSMATCALPPVSYTTPDKLDLPLRRYSLRTMRPQVKKDDVGLPMQIEGPSASRTIEVLVEPILPFELAIFTEGSITLGPTGSWGVDSYDSRDLAKSSLGGTYPGRSSPKVQDHGHVASNRSAPPEHRYWPLIDARGATVRGLVATNGGDNPETPAPENVAGALNLDPAKIRSDFHREFPLPRRPVSGSFSPTPAAGEPFAAGTMDEPKRYLVGGNLGAFRVSGPLLGRGAVVIFVNGDLDTAGGEIVIPPNVTAQVFVRGNVDFRSSSINTGLTSSRRPAQLQIFGEDSGGSRRTLLVQDGGSVAAAFYGPHYEVRLGGNVEWFGSIAGRSFEVVGGGTGGVHYDEALSIVGRPITFRIARYVEDVRQ